RKSRARAETRFKWFGRIAIGVSLTFLFVMVGSIILKGKGALVSSDVAITVGLGPDAVDPSDIQATRFDALMKKSLREMFPEVTSRKDKKKLYGLLSVDMGFELRDQILQNPKLLGQPQKLWFTASDDVDLFLKGSVNRTVSEDNRRISDMEISWIDSLSETGDTRSQFNTKFFTNGDSREPELAGILSALIGSILTLLVCFVVSFPVAILAAIYLEEFAPKNKLSAFIEVNINNLAAVPSIVFGLLGLAVLLSVFGLPRSTPLVGGLVLSLMTLPTIIIAARAALRAVPPSIREAALGMGASPVQATFHHVAPLALPGILTGTIVGMAQALGETAPLLMIGMVAFIADVPSSIVEPATALPVQIFLWADASERAFVEKTSAAIIVLLVFLVVMNLLAIYLRKKFEKRF
ncbi:MAG: phosphate ABC transporter permease PstA, partial [Amylibacter sp.]